MVKMTIVAILVLKNIICGHIHLLFVFKHKVIFCILFTVKDPIKNKKINKCLSCLSYFTLSIGSMLVYD